MEIPIRRLSYKLWIRLLAIWTVAALSMSTQMYLKQKLTNPDEVWFYLFLRQLPTWYLCALLTPVIIYLYDKYPLHTSDWKKNLLRQAFVALLILLSVFSHLRLFAMAFIVHLNLMEFSARAYLNAYLSQVVWDLAIYSFILIAIFADKSNKISKQNALHAAQVELRNKELENLLNSAQLEALKLQLSPHFLFNTLNTVSSLVRAQEYNLAIQINSRLGDFLRTTLYADHNQFVSLRKELSFTDLYLEIELLRFRDRLKIEKNISPEALDILIPYFILQPLLENAIKHGIAKMSQAKLISIGASVQNTKLHISIFNEGRLLEGSVNSTGIGLENVCSRLKKLYGDDYGFSIQDHQNRGGVIVNLNIPLKKNYASIRG